MSDSLKIFNNIKKTSQVLCWKCFSWRLSSDLMDVTSCQTDILTEVRLLHFHWQTQRKRCQSNVTFAQTPVSDKSHLGHTQGAVMSSSPSKAASQHWSDIKDLVYTGFVVHYILLRSFERTGKEVLHTLHRSKTLLITLGPFSIQTLACLLKSGCG